MDNQSGYFEINLIRFLQDSSYLNLLHFKPTLQCERTRFTQLFYSMHQSHLIKLLAAIRMIECFCIVTNNDVTDSGGEQHCMTASTGSNGRLVHFTWLGV